MEINIILTSLVFSGFEDFTGEVCLSFFYMLFGTKMGSLSVHITRHNSISNELIHEILFNEEEYSLREWQQVFVRFKMEKGVKV